VERLVVRDLVTLESPLVEVTLHPFDLIIVGEASQVARAQAVLAARLTMTKAYITWSKAANEIEDELRRAWLDLTRAERGNGALLSRARERLHAIEEDLHRAKLAFEEWEVLYRGKLQVEAAELRARAAVRGAA
jgi:hypothetical protein